MKFVVRIEGGSLRQMVTLLKGFEDLFGFAELLNTAGEAIRKSTVAAKSKQTNLSSDTF